MSNALPPQELEERLSELVAAEGASTSLQAEVEAKTRQLEASTSEASHLREEIRLLAETESETEGLRGALAAATAAQVLLKFRERSVKFRERSVKFRERSVKFRERSVNPELVKRRA